MDSYPSDLPVYSFHDPECVGEFVIRDKENHPSGVYQFSKRLSVINQLRQNALGYDDLCCALRLSNSSLNIVDI
ncbi:hypothetical protein BN996_03160 [Haloferax massiliensis]|uniref:Uncharacterized protein n=1 Tax=Haloferax massiliensis TaxID=1476858 RepID=A0A0D6JUQ1_9EURY|nr:hypothetical protein BN996_03160 [Haloferax massiliensis]